jgi:hypothetical protein
MHNALFAAFAPIEGEPYSQAFEASFERVVPEAVHWSIELTAEKIMPDSSDPRRPLPQKTALDSKRSRPGKHAA